MTPIRDEPLVLYLTGPLFDRGSIWANVSKSFGLIYTLESLGTGVLTSCCLSKLS